MLGIVGLDEQGEASDGGVDLERANAARMYDYFLGGAHNFAVDRDHAAKLLDANPDMRYLAGSNRAFLGRVVRWCTERGVDQFLDLGSGVPTVGNVHEIAHQRLPRARVAYVDHEPVAVAHAREIVAELDTVTVTRADLRETDAVLSAPGVSGLLDLTRPVALLAVSCLHFVPGDVEEIMARYRSRLPAGSVMAISHVSDDLDDAETVDRVRMMIDAFAGSASRPTARPRAGIAALFGDYELVRPGLVDIIDWPATAVGESARPTGFFGGVATAPAPGSGELTR